VSWAAAAELASAWRASSFSWIAGTSLARFAIKPSKTHGSQIAAMQIG